jgi:hypothetical protein
MPTVPGHDVGVRSACGVLAVAWVALGSSLGAQTYTGPSKCVGCHDHERQARKWQKEEPAAFKGKAHYNTLKQLDAPKSAQWAKAIGLADPYDLKGSCVKCHGTVFRGDANAGVSCESCHGPSSKYNDVHQEKGAYAKAVAAGLVDLKEKPNAIAKTCVECHVLKDAKLAAAGHPVGDKFDAGVSLEKLVHWDTKYSYPQITTAAKGMMGKPIAPVAQPPSGGVPPPPASPAGGGVPPAVSVAPPATPTKASPKSASPRPATPPPAPWDWDQPIAPLPDDYQPEPVSIAQDQPVAPPPPAVVPPPRASPPSAPSAGRATSSAPAATSQSGSTEGSSSTGSSSTSAPAPPPSPRSATAEAVALRGESVRVLEKLLRAGARTPNAKPPAKPSEFSGPDSELLRLQDEVMALALEALRSPK